MRHKYLFGIVMIAACFSGCGHKDKTPAAPVSAAETPVVTQTAPTYTPAPTATPTPYGTEGDVSFSCTEYFLKSETRVKLENRSGKDGFITYTFDGTEPEKDGEKYSEALVLSPLEDGSETVFTISAKAWYTDGSESKTYVHSYIIGENVDKRYTTRVIIISGDPAYLTDEPDTEHGIQGGIMAAENVHLTGRESERKIHIEMIDTQGKSEIDQFCGIRVHGGKTRDYDRVSLKIFARKEYEDNKGSFKFSGFNAKNENGVTVGKYDKLVIDSTSDDYNSAMIRDELCMRLAEKAGIKTIERVLPVTVYINGFYYGLFWLHEAYCDDYFQNMMGKGNGEYITLDGGEYTKFQSTLTDPKEIEAAKEYNSMAHKYFKLDMTDDKNFEAISKLVDIDNYLEYMALNIYIQNDDWPMRNNRTYKYFPDNGVYGSGDKDGKWRYLVHDMDCVLGRWKAYDTRGAEIDSIAAAIFNDDVEKGYAPLLASLLKREDCRKKFVEKLEYFMNEIFSEESIRETLTPMLSERDTELKYYLKSLKKSSTTYGSLVSRDDSIENIYLWARLRPDYMKKFIQNMEKQLSK